MEAPPYSFVAPATLPASSLPSPVALPPASASASATPASAPSSLPPSALEVPLVVAAAMEVDAGGEKPSEKENFLAAESGAASVFASLARADLAAALSLRNKDDRSLVHIATANGGAPLVRGRAGLIRLGTSGMASWCRACPVLPCSPATASWPMTPGLLSM
ncbi:hypothetical protein ZWY2020_016877 [Hordeum vulgare]|nr:hypothetical protein ZWY2020_016877 [Hordeum vulgare]